MKERLKANHSHLETYITERPSLIVLLLLPQIPEEMSRCRNSYVEQALLPRRLEDLAGEEAGQGGYRTCLQDSLDALLKEAKDKFKGYDSCSTPEHAELACRKVKTARCSSFFISPIWLLSVCLFVAEDDTVKIKVMKDNFMREKTASVHLSPSMKHTSSFQLSVFPVSSKLSPASLNISWKTST